MNQMRYVYALQRWSQDTTPFFVGAPDTVVRFELADTQVLGFWIPRQASFVAGCVWHLLRVVLMSSLSPFCRRQGTFDPSGDKDGPRAYFLTCYLVLNLSAASTSKRINNINF